MKFTSKKFISIITLIALLLTATAIFASCGSSAPADASGTLSDGKITWKYYSSSKTIAIEGSSKEPVEMPNFSKDSPAPWYDYRDYITEIEIEGVSTVSDYAFYNLFYVNKISFEDESVRTIGKFAFAFCGGKVTVAEGESGISLELPEGITSIGDSAFEGALSLGSVTIPNSVTGIGAKAFAYTQNLNKITMSEALNTSLADSLENIFQKGIDSDKNVILPTIETVAPPAETEAPAEGDATAEAPSEEETSAESETEETKETEETEKASDETEKAAEDETEAEPENKTTTIIAIVILALVIVGIIVGAILLMRSNKKQTKDYRTVRKNDNAKNGKNTKKSSKGKKK